MIAAAAFGMKLLAVLVISAVIHSVSTVDRKHQCKIGIAALNDFLDPASGCNTTQSIVSKDGILHLATEVVDSEHHSYSQHSAPFWFEKRIKESTYYTEDLNKADAIFVNDYCFLATYIVGLQAQAIDATSVAAWVQGYNLLQQTVSFKKFNGTNFAIFAPFPPTGPAEIVSQMCSEFSRSLHISAEAAQQYVCDLAEPRKNQLLVPYLSAKFVEDKDGWPERDIFIYFQGNCGFRDNTHGTYMRRHFVDALKPLRLPNVTAHCNIDRQVPHTMLRRELKRSIFCPIIPGDTASSRRLTEVILSGCVPIFLGPPWHTMPLAQELQYNDFALFFWVGSLARLSKIEFATNTSSTVAIVKSQAPSIFDPAWWVADSDVSEHAIHVPDVDSVVEYLKAMPALQLQGLQENNAETMSFFRYRSNENAVLQSSKTATDIIIETMCRRGLGLARRLKSSMRNKGALV